MIGKRTAFPFATEPIDASSKLGSGSAFVRQDVGPRIFNRRQPFPIRRAAQDNRAPSTYRDGGPLRSGAAQRPPGAVKGHVPGFDGLVALDHCSCLHATKPVHASRVASIPVTRLPGSGINTPWMVACQRSLDVTSVDGVD